jgi:DNA repair photolyase
MRWDGQTLEATDQAALPGLDRISGLVRSVQTPEFAGITFHEVVAKSALNRVPEASALPYRWTVNPWRGCAHACVYCFARRTHSYLELDTGRGFDTEIVVKTNVAEVLRRELARPSWQHETVALGTNTDPYQRAEGRYRLMPGIIEALAGSQTPFSILTKGTLLKRDLSLIAKAADRVEVRLGVSLAILDPALHGSLEPGAPSPRARLELISAIRDAGLSVGVLVAPVLPWLTDTPAHLDEMFGALATAGATSASAMALHLRPGAREWFFTWLERERPDLVGRYVDLYAGGSYAAPWYRNALRARVQPYLVKHGFAAPRGPLSEAERTQLRDGQDPDGGSRSDRPVAGPDNRGYVEDTDELLDLGAAARFVQTFRLAPRPRPAEVPAAAPAPTLF